MLMHQIDIQDKIPFEIIDKTNNLDCEKDDNIMTEYEKKFHNLGININKLEAIKK